MFQYNKQHDGSKRIIFSCQTFIVLSKRLSKNAFRCSNPFFCAFVTALSGEESLEKWGGPRDGGKVSHGGNNIGNGDSGGIGIDTGGGDIGDIGVGVVATRPLVMPR